MPIEELFSKVKSFLRANDPYIQIANESEIKDIIFAAFASLHQAIATTGLSIVDTSRFDMLCRLGLLEVLESREETAKIHLAMQLV